MAKEETHPARPAAAPLKFSVVIAAFNAERYVAEAVESAIGQQGVEMEVLVVDDGSTDRTAEVVGRFGPPVRLVQQANRGAAAARNQGLVEASAGWVAFLDADDLFLPGHLARVARGIADHPRAILFYGDVEARDESLRPLKTLRSFRDHTTARERLVRNNFIYSNSVVARRDALLACGGFPEDLRHAGEDWELWVRMAWRGPIIHLGHTAGVYRWRTSSKMRSPGPGLRDDNLRALARLSCDLPLPPALVRRARAQIYYESGVRYLAAGMRLEAREEFGRALEIEPGDARPWAARLLSYAPAPFIQLLRRLRRRGG